MNRHISYILRYYDILVFTESWFDNEVNEKILNSLNYNIYRCNRNFELTNKCKGGGAVVMVNNKLSSEIIISSSAGFFDQLSIKINFLNYKLI